jgi:hypothetical protein
VATKKIAPKRRDDDPLDVRPPGGDGTDDLGDVVITQYPDGVFLLPTAMRRASARQRQAFDQIVGLQYKLMEDRKLIDQAVEHARKNGISWASIGWALGISGDGALKRFGSD